MKHIDLFNTSVLFLHECNFPLQLAFKTHTCVNPCVAYIHTPRRHTIDFLALPIFL